ncbi:hypothetical protein JW766_03560 [Candidatus Dojkabacteria bacterium]|nr:hypothetical protein [Candidatus Dojkabacteria bacterium]
MDQNETILASHKSIINKIKKIYSKNSKDRRIVYIAFSAILIVSIALYIIYNVFVSKASPQSLVHDTQSEFEAGTGNRLITSHEDFSTSEHTPDEHTLGLWHMNNDWNDSSGNGYDGAPVADATFTTNASLGSHAGSFDGDGDYIVVPNETNTGTGDFTLEMWVNIRDLPVSHRLTTFFGFWHGSNRYRQFGYARTDYLNFHANKFHWYDIGTTYEFTGTYDYNMFMRDKWVHVAFVGTGGNKISLYVNGDFDSQIDVSYDLSAPNETWIGYGERYFNGLIDEVRISDVALTEGEIKESIERRMRVQTYYQELPADEHTVGLWHMNDNWEDSSSKNNDGTAFNEATFTPDGILGSAGGTFDGTGDCVTTPSSGFDGNVGTVEGWFNITSSPGYRYIFNIRTSNIDEVAVFVNDFNDLIYEVMDTVQLYPSRTVELKSWHHFALVWDNGSYRGYFDGEERVTGTYTGTITTQNINIGRKGDNTYFWNGMIDEIRLSNNARTPEEIKASAQRRPYGVYTSEVLDLGDNLVSIDSIQWNELGVETGDGETPHSTDGLVAQWNFNEISGTTATNNAGSCGATCNGTLTNFSDTSAQDVLAGSGWTSNNRRWGNGAIMIDGNDDLIDIANNPNVNLSGPFTLEAWVNARNLDPSNRNGIIHKANNNNCIYYNYSIHTTNDGTGNVFEFISYINSTCIVVRGTKSIQLGKWYHVAGVYDGSEMKLYVNGILESSEPANGAVYNNTYPVRIGYQWHDVTGNYLFWDGIIDSSRIYSRALSEDEVLSNYQAGQIEFQTRTSPDGVSWEAWSPTTGNSLIDSMDSYLYNSTDGGLVSYWPIDETSDDSCGGGEDVCDISSSLQGTDSRDTNIIDGVFGKARYFDGTEYVNVGDQSSLDFGTGDFAVSYWLKTDETPTTYPDYILSKEVATSDNGFSFKVNTSNNLEFLLDGDPAYTTTYTTNINDGDWHHIVGNKQGDELELFVDGEQKDSVAGVNAVDVSSTGGFILGGSQDFRRWSQSGQDLRIESVISTSDGGWMLCGHVNSADWSIVAIKLDSSFEIEWQRTYRLSNLASTIQDITQTSDDGYLITGNMRVSSYSYDAIMLKIDSTGNPLWQKRSNNGNWYDHTSVTIEDGTDLVVAGRDDAFRGAAIVRMDSAGTIAYQRAVRFKGYRKDVFSDIEIVNDGNYLAVGNTYAQNIENDALLVKLDPATGNVIWANGFLHASPGSYSESRAFIEDSSGDILIQGYTNTIGEGDNDIFIARTDSAGNISWLKTLGTTASEYTERNSIVETSGGDIIFVGNSNISGTQAGVVVRFKKDGTVVYTKTFDKSGDDYFTDIEINGDIMIISGYTKSFSANEESFILYCHVNGECVSLDDISLTEQTHTETVAAATFSYDAWGWSNTTTTAGAGASTLSADFQFPFEGSIDEVRVYSSALSDSSIYELATEGIDNVGIQNSGLHLSRDTSLKVEGTSAWKGNTGAAKLDEHTVALWHLDETNGDLAGDDVVDSSRNGNHGEFYGSDVHNGVTQGIANKGIKFNGTDDYISVDHNEGLNPSTNWSISFWLKTSVSSAADDRPIHKGTNWNDYQFLVCYSASPNKIRYHQNVSGYSDPGLASTSDVNDGKWHHVAVTRNGNVTKLYFDGNEEDSSSVDPGNVSATTPMAIGARADDSNHYNGSLDEVSVYNTTLTPEEIAETYRMGRDHRVSHELLTNSLSDKTKMPFWVAADRPGTYIEATVGESEYVNYQPDENTVGLWHLEEDSGYCTSAQSGCIKDSSGNDDNGTPSSSPHTSQGMVGKGWYFDGIDDHILVPDNPEWDIPNSVFTQDAWFKVYDNTPPHHYRILFRASPTSNSNWGMTVLATSGNFYCAIRLNTLTVTEVNTGIQVSENEWHHGVCVWDGSNIYAYLDGRLAGVGGLSGTYNPQNDPVYIGTDDNIGQTLYGLIDEARISNIARTAEEVRQTYEIGRRTHPITIDFGASLDSGDLITGAGDTSFTIDATTYGFSNKGDNLYVGDKIIAKENYGGSEYIAQGTVASVDQSSGAVTVTGWDSGSTFPGSGFTQNATIFKWQEEWFDVRSSLPAHRDALTNLTLRVTDGSEGRTIWIDNLTSSGPYLSNPTATGNVTSTTNRYIQYRFFESSYDRAISSSVSSVTLNYNQRTASVSSSNISVSENIYAGRTFDVQTVYSDSAGAADLDQLYLRIQNPSSTDIEYIASEGVDTTGQTPTEVSGGGFIKSITYDRDTESPTANDITIIWHIATNWNWVEDANIEYGVRAIEDTGPDTGWDFTNNDYFYENDLTFTGNLSVTGSDGRALSNGSWVYADELLDWSGLKVVYEGTTDVYPPDSDFDVSVINDDGFSWQDLQSSGGAINITTRADAVYDAEEVYNVDILNIPAGGSDISNVTFALKVDDIYPDIIDIVGDYEGIWQNVEPGPVISWTDPESHSDDTFYITIDGSDPTEANYRWKTTLPTYDLPFIKHTETIVRSRAVNGAKKYGPIYDFVLRYDGLAPPNVSNLKSVHETETSIKLTWDNPTIRDFDHVLIIRKAGSIPQNPEDGDVVYEGDAESLLDENVEADTTYYYVVYSFDILRNRSSGAVTTPKWEEEGIEEPEEVEEIEPEDLEGDIIFIIDGNEFTIASDSDLHAYQDSLVQVKVALNILIEGKEDLDIVQVIFVIGDEVYIMEINEAGDYYITDFDAPDVLGEYNTHVIVTYSDDTGRKINIDLTIDPYGYVYSLFAGSELRLEGAKVTLYQEVDGEQRLWLSNNEAYLNPAYTDQQGEFGFMVAPGRYKLTAEAEGYESNETAWFDVSVMTVNKNILLDRHSILDSAIDWIRLNSSLLTNISLATLATSIGLAALSLLLLLRGGIFNIKALVDAIMVALNLKKDNAFGVVIDPLGRKPVAFAVMRVFDKERRQKLVKVTDLNGRYGIVLERGTYTLEVSHPDYEKYTNKVTIEQAESQRLELVIEMMSLEAKAASKTFFKLKKLSRSMTRILMEFLLIFSATLSIVNVIIKPDKLNIILASVSAIVILVRILPILLKRKSWGEVKDSYTDKSVDFAYVRLYNYTTKELVDMQISDKKGKFSFVAGRGKFNVLVTAKGYKFPSEKQVQMATWKDSFIPIDVGDQGVIAKTFYVDSVAGSEIGDRTISPFAA